MGQNKEKADAFGNYLEKGFTLFPVMNEEQGITNFLIETMQPEEALYM